MAEALKKRMDRDETITPELFRAEIAKAGEEALRAFAATAEKNEQVNIDNAENSGYTGENGGVVGDGSELHGASGEGIRRSTSDGYRSTSEQGALRQGDLLHVRERRGVTVSSGGVVTTGILSSRDSAAFSRFLSEARVEDTENGWAVTHKTADELADHEIVLAVDGSAGAAVAQDGDIQAVFRNRKTGVKGSMEAIIPRTLELGGTKLDCYGDGLVYLYEKYGFTPVARVEFNEQYANDGWNASKGTPYIYFMVHNGDSAETVAANIGKYPHMELSQLESLPTYGKEGYDQAAAYRDGLLTRRGVHGALDGGSSVATAQTQAQQIAQRKSDTVSAQTENAPETQKAASGGNDVSASARQTDRMSRDDFAVQFRKGQKNASELDVDLAYQDYLEGAATEGNSAAGLVQNERSAQLTKKEADAIDALGKLFGRRFVMDDLGENNGIWNEEGDIRIDIAPRHNGAKNVFLFTAEHEIGHEVRSRIGTLAWKRLEDAAITIKGSDAVAEKQASDEAYAKESAAREDVTCDFIGELLSDKETLDAFLRSIRNGEQVKNLRGIRALISAAKSFFGRLAGRGSRNANAEVLVRKVQEQFGADIASARRAVSELQQAVTEAVSARRDGGRTEKFSKKENREERYDETAAYRNEPLARREQAESTLKDGGTGTSEATGRGRRKITQDDVNVSVLENENGYSADIGGEKFDFIWKQNLDGEGRTLYNKSGERSAQLTDVIRRLHTGETVPVEEVMRLPEVELASALSEAEETIRLPDRTELRNAGYEDAMRLGSYNSETGKLDGEILRERRMDIVIGLPGSGKSSVYSHRLSEEYGERIIDTDDFRSYIPEYNGMNSPVVHREASLMRDMVLKEAVLRGENILLSTVGANPKALANRVRDSVSIGGYSVYLHLNELPYLESVARVLERYVGKDGKLGRIVMPDRVYRDKGAPTQAYLEVTGQEGYYETFKVDGDVSGSREMGGSARARDVRTATEGARREGESGAREGSERKGENDVSDLLSGFDWRNNDVAHGEAPVVVQADRASEIDRTAVKRYSKKDSAHKVAPQLEQRNEETNAEIQTVGQLVRSVERAERRAAISEEIAHETLAKTDAVIAEQTAERPKMPSVIPSKAERISYAIVDLANRLERHCILEGESQIRKGVKWHILPDPAEAVCPRHKIYLLYKHSAIFCFGDYL